MQRILVVIGIVAVIFAGGFLFLLGRADQIKPERKELTLVVPDTFPK